uniref:Uncharacterized protein AlNc14C12G1435 n=1 Tax=Albugo laibachii Nc14 TaxID=890382 RepID=F0W357_9STRA|nr:conserved hypothetical protein [Albugo laibachii Nc14]|eukprot:CCA15497.1 conserved hypothetical protein [Albugo laibachii Nc14]
MCRVTTGASQKSTREIGTATVISREGEEAIKLWVNYLRKEVVPISALMLQLKARSVAEVEGVLSDVFTGAWSWRNLFLKRHGLSFRTRTRQGQQIPPDVAAAAEKFWVSADRVCCELGVTKIYSADQSGICFEYLPKLIVSRKGEKTVWVRCSGKDKQQFTGMFLGVSDGNQYPPFYVLKTPPSKNSDTAERSATTRYGFGVRLWKDIKVLSESTGAQIYGNRCEWWNSALSIEFLDYRFAARDSEEPVLLLWDAFSAYWTEEVVQHAEDLNVFLLKVPPGLTSWVQFVVQQLKDHDVKDDQAPFKLLPPSRSDAVNWACKLRQQLGPQIVKSGFKQRTIPENIPELHQDELVELLQIHLVIDETISEANDVIVDAVC